MKSVFINCDNILVCPKCGNEHLQNKKIDVFSGKEDEEKCVHITSTQKNTFVTIDNGKGDPSLRRSRLAIIFICKKCGEKNTLEFGQYEGSTYVGWKPK